LAGKRGTCNGRFVRETRGAECSGKTSKERGMSHNKRRSYALGIKSITWEKRWTGEVERIREKKGGVIGWELIYSQLSHKEVGDRGGNRIPLSQGRKI